MRDPQYKKIMYKGLSTTPDDYLCEDGELMGAVGVEHLDGDLVSSTRYQPDELMSFPMDGYHYEAIFIHKYSSYNHIIIRQYKSVNYVEENNYYWIDFDPSKLTAFNPDTSEQFIAGKKVKSATAIGNTIILNTDKGLIYVLYKEGAYIELGSHIPELPVTFGLQSEWCRYYNNYGVVDPEDESSSTETTSNEKKQPFLVSGLTEGLSPDNSDIPYVSDDNKSTITTAIMAKVNKMNYEVSQKGMFSQPFLVRYALRLYDGSYTMHSSPVLMPVTGIGDDTAGTLAILDWWNNGDKQFRFHLEYMRSKLDYAAKAAALAKLQNWKDIVKGIDIYVSAPLYTYKPGEQIEEMIGAGIDTSSEEKQPSADSVYNKYYDQLWSIAKPVAEKDLPLNYCKRLQAGLSEANWVNDTTAYHSTRQFYTYDSDTKKSFFFYPLWGFQLPKKAKSDWCDEVKDCSQFYLIKKIDLDDIKTERTVIDIDDDYLTSLVAREPMDDEYRSHDSLYPSTEYIYNSRLNVGNVERKLYSGFDIECLFPYQDAGQASGRTADTTTIEAYMAVEVKDDTKTHIVRSAKTTLYEYGSYQYLYYPNEKAVAAYIGSDTAGSQKILLSEHTGLNGAVCCETDFKNYWIRGVDLPQEQNGTITEHNKLYTSLAENPFVFEAKSINTIGQGTILALSSATKPMSQGQFGSYPLYVFTTEGIYAMTVSETGGWASIPPPATRDVVTYPNSICQTDDAVIFPTKRGLMIIQGQDTALMSECFKDKQTFDVNAYPYLRELLTDHTFMDLGAILYEYAAEEEENITDEMIADFYCPDFRKYIASDFNIYYDYRNQRVVLGRNDRINVFIYSFDSKTWTCAPWTLYGRINSYPDAYAMLKTVTGSTYLVSLNADTDISPDEDYAEAMPNDGVVITRPIKCEEFRDKFKELEVAIHHGRFQRSAISLMVYGTINFKDYYYAGSSKSADLYHRHGQYYKAFVIVLFCSTEAEDYIDDITLQYEVRRDGKLHGMGYN